LSFFKKKRFSEVEGYERISRLIEDRQRGLAGEGGDDDALDEDTVLLSPQARAPREPIAESVSLVRPSESRETVPSEPPAGSMRPEAFAPPAAPTPAPRMKLPEIPAMTGAASLVSKDAVWDGKLVCSGDVKIEGTLEGEIETSGTLFVAAEARVHGTVRARNVMLAGDIDGQLRCGERLEILPGGSARGEIDTGTLVVHEGAFIESRFQMRQGSPAARV
jgi:cytoskeletal protein CcmA (bactofilin family)